MFYYLQCVGRAGGAVSGVQQMVKSAIRAVLPRTLAAGIIEKVESAHSIPSDSTIRRYRFILDAALLFWTQDELERAPPTLRYMWADSSPTKRADYLWFEHHALSGESILSSLDIVRTMHLEEYQEALKAGFIPDAMRELLARLRLSVVHHIHTPCAMGHGKTDIAHKSAAMVHALALTCPSIHQIATFLNSIVSVCTDMGTELGLATFQGRLEELLPRGFAFQPMEVDDVAFQIEAQVAEQAVFFLPQAIPVPGLQHCIHNLMREAHEFLEHWPVFWKQLKNLESLLRWHFRRQVLIWTCILGSPFHDRETDFEKFSASLYENRWHEVVKFVAKAWPLVLVLRFVWDPGKYSSRVAQGGEGDDEQEERADTGAGTFDVQLMTSTLNDKLFFCYMTLVKRVDSLPERVSSWGEGCSCHEVLLEGKTTYERISERNIDWTGSIPILALVLLSTSCYDERTPKKQCLRKEGL
jgi:hypothetical protein